MTRERRSGTQTVEWRATPLAEQFPLEVFEVEQTRECHFKKKKPHEDGRRRLGCERCGKAKLDPCHLGTGGSFNAFGSGGGGHAGAGQWQGIKAQWEKVLDAKLREVGLPLGLGGVFVEGRMTFPDRAARDQGNFRVVLEKALGDVLQSGGWLEADDWTRYEFGGLAYAYVAGVSRTELRIYPRWPVDDGQVSLLP